MNREIKFRAWDGVQMFGAGFNDVFEFHRNREGKAYCIGYANLERAGAHTLRLMQYTGLKDKNGVEIFEGDLITNHGVTNDMKQRVFVVVWNSEGARFSLHDVRAKMKSSLDRPSGSQQEVIGNIHENPELVEGK